MLMVYEISWEPHGISYSPDFLEILMKISCHVSPKGNPVVWPVPTGTISPKPTDVSAMTTSGSGSVFRQTPGPGIQSHLESKPKMVILGDSIIFRMIG